MKAAFSESLDAWGVPLSKDSSSEHDIDTSIRNESTYSLVRPGMENAKKEGVWISEDFSKKLSRLSATLSPHCLRMELQESKFQKTELKSKRLYQNSQPLLAEELDSWGIPQEVTSNSELALVDEPLEEKLLLKTWDEYASRVSEAYLARPSSEPGLTSSWASLIRHVEKMFGQIQTRIKIEFVEEDPYRDEQDLFKDIEQNKRLQVYTGFSDHPIWTQEQNLKFRAVHDYLSHQAGKHSFGLKGEIAAYNQHVKTAPKDALVALFTEVVGQACVKIVTGAFPEQKITRLHGFDYVNLGKVDEEEFKKNFDLSEERDHHGDAWVHFSDFPEMKINPRPFHQDPAGIYLFPEGFDPAGMWSSRRYKFICRLSDQAKVLDLGDMTAQDAANLLSQIIPGQEFEARVLAAANPVDEMWEILKNEFVLKDGKRLGQWNQALRKIGYDAVFDDTGSIFVGEPQLLVLDPRQIRVLDRQDQRTSGYEKSAEILEFIADVCREAGMQGLSVETPRKRREWGESYLSGSVEGSFDGLKMEFTVTPRFEKKDSVVPYEYAVRMKERRYDGESSGLSIKAASPAWHESLKDKILTFFSRLKQTDEMAAASL